MERAAPILIRIYKEESTLEVWKQDRTGRFVLLNTYPICKYSGKLGPKIVEGDRQAPEGFYDVALAQMNPNSSEYLAFNIGFPNAFDRSLGRTGRFLMVHGGCRSVGCYAMTDAAMEEIYGLVYEAFRGGQEKVQVQALPFHMTAETWRVMPRTRMRRFGRCLRSEAMHSSRMDVRRRSQYAISGTCSIRLRQAISIRTPHAHPASSRGWLALLRRSCRLYRRLRIHRLGPQHLVSHK